MAEFRMPSLGADMDAGTLVEWRKNVGDRVERGELVATVETEKGAIDVECWESGVLESIRVRPGEKVPVGTVLATLRAEGEPAAAPEPIEPPRERRRVSPVARKLALELGVELSQVTGTGPGGAVQREDVAAFAAARATPKSAAPPAPSEDQRLAAMRHAIGAAMSRSKREIPHYYVGAEVDLTRCLDWVARQNERRPLAERLLPAVPMLRAVARAAVEVPGFNGHFVDGRFQPAAGVTLGVVVSLRGGGVVVAAVPEAGTLDVDELRRRLDGAVERARTGALRSSDFAPPTLTVSSLGERGADVVYGIVFPPQVALVGFGRIAERPLAVAGNVVARRATSLTLAADHRVTDGLAGSRFLAAIDRRLQHPEEP